LRNEKKSFRISDEPVPQNCSSELMTISVAIKVSVGMNLCKEIDLKNEGESKPDD